MTLRQTKKGWHARYRNLYGKETAKNFRLKADANAWLEENRREVRLVKAGLAPDPRLATEQPQRHPAGTVVQAVTEWLGTKQTLSPRTRKD